MKSIVALAILASASLTAGFADAKPKAGKTVAKVAPVPAHHVAAPAKPPPPAKPAKPVKPKPSFFLASDPHVPLVKIEANGDFLQIGARGKECGDKNRWAKPKTKWKAIDAWGQVSGELELAGSELYDVTHCREAYFSPRSGTEGVGLFVSQDSGWQPPKKSAAWSPTDEEKKHFEHFMKTIEGAYVDGRPIGKEDNLAMRTRYFEIEWPKDMHGPKHWAVAGGPILVVAYLGEQGKWKASTVKSPMTLADSYRPIAIFDMNGDGVPEIIYRASDGPSWSDSVLKLTNGTSGWDDAATSPGGATL